MNGEHKPIFAPGSTRLTLAVVAAALVSGLLSTVLTANDHILLTPAEQDAVIGGVPIPNALCVGGGVCSQPDTLCSVGNAYCEENEAGTLCADKKDYQNPTRCGGAETSLCCDDEDETQQHVICYLYSLCYCKLSGGTLTCSDEVEEFAPPVVRKCKVLSCPPQGT